MPGKLKRNIVPFLVKSFLAISLLQARTYAAFEANFRSLDFDCLPNVYMDVKALTSSFVFDVFACQVLCLRKLECLSINYEKRPNKDSLHLCEVLNKVKSNSRLVTRTSDRFDFYIALRIPPRSCSHAKSIGFEQSRNYTINPDASGKTAPFQVFCDMRDKDGVGVTVVSHDSEARTEVSPGCESAGCYRRDVNYYGISDVIAQLGALADVSIHCEQYIKYECQGSRINGKAWLKSRDGRRLDYWGGASPGSRMCACGVAGNCTGRGRCNCDINQNRWLEDSGVLNYKDDLPITMLRFGDATPPHEKAWHTLGKLRCYGQA